MTLQTFETTAGKVDAELQRLGIDPAVPVTVNPISRLLEQARASVRAYVDAANLSDPDIDRLIREARSEVAAEGS